MTGRLDGKVAIVTGAGGGIGREHARLFAAEGAAVLVNDTGRRTGADAAAVATEIESAGGRAVADTNSATWDGADAIVEHAIDAFGRVDILVNNATAARNADLWKVTEQEWDLAFDVNLKGYFWCAREVARHLSARSAPGSIINVASVAGLVASPMQGIYSMTKAAVISMTKTLALELGPSGIRVNAIAPGFVDTRLASAVLKNDDLVKALVGRTPIGRYGTPDEIAGGALYLASDAASFLTGHTLVIDGGLTIG